MKRCLIVKLLGAFLLAVVTAAGSYALGSLAVHPQMPPHASTQPQPAK